MKPSQRFSEKLDAYKKLIDDDIDKYAKEVKSRTQETYGNNGALVSDAYFDLLKRGGKRLRGSLTLVGYEMCGGTDREMIIQAARAIEMMHAYILIIDDIQDRSNLRRGGPSVHKMLESSHVHNKWRRSADHTGTALSLNAALLGLHGAELVLSNLPVSEELRLKALSIMNHTMVVTVHGQTHDIINEISDEVTTQDLEQVMQWKTAHYSVLNPIHMGMVLAGAPCEDTNAITQYAIHIGKAFQITDDMLIVSSDSGKNGRDDIVEGKRTLVTAYALKHAPTADRKFLLNCLGNRELTDEDFDRCKAILISSGAVEYAREKAGEHTAAGLASLFEHADRWGDGSVAFLKDLANYILTRSS